MANQTHKGEVVKKPWGYELIWAHTARYVGKVLHINKGESLSYQYHRVKDETVRLLSGSINPRTRRRRAVGRSLRQGRCKRLTQPVSIRDGFPFESHTAVD